jgi:hypothetical protein
LSRLFDCIVWCSVTLLFFFSFLPFCSPGDHDLKYESVDMIFCRPEDGSTLKRGGSYATIASAMPNQHGGGGSSNNNNNSPTGGLGGTAVTLVTTMNGTTKPLPSVPASAVMNGNVGMLANGGSLAGYGVGKSENHENNDLTFPNGQ